MPDYNIKQLRGAFGAGMAAAEKAAGTAEKEAKLVGKSFHSFKNGIVEWQGRILGEPSAGVFLIQLYSWIDGRETDQKLIPFSEMQDWAFYASDEAMIAAYENKYAAETRAWARARWESTPA